MLQPLRTVSEVIPKSIDSEAMENPYAAPQGEIIQPTAPFTPLTWKQILFSFEGRIPRRQYWGALGIQMLTGFAIGFIVVFMIPELLRRSPESGPGAGVVILIVPIVIFVLWISLAVGVKRWHDRDKSGWWMLIGIIPYIGGIWQLIECGCLRGTEGPNRFGGDPT
jgi:uncharacterized membrane protein YhaH (DUF805 family)